METEVPHDTEYQERLTGIIARGETGRWRTLLSPSPEAEGALANLLVRAPHFAELAGIVTMHLRSANVIGLPISLPPILLVGGHGLGKSWFLSRLAALLNPELPFRRHIMSSASLNDGLDGSHPSYRNAQPGLVAKTLLTENVANPLLFVDELDKVPGALLNLHGDPFRPFYALLDPADSNFFGDQYLGFPINASAVLWVMAANDPSLLPAPIIDRLKILVVPEPDEAQRACVALSIYDEANRSRRCFFEAELGRAVVERLAGLTPRMMRRCLDDAMARVAADHRRRLKADDLILPSDQTKKRIGFCH